MSAGLGASRVGWRAHIAGERSAELLELIAAGGGVVDLDLPRGELAAARSADLVILVMPPAGAALVVAGVAAASGVPVVVYAPHGVVGQPLPPLPIAFRPTGLLELCLSAVHAPSEEG